MTELKEEFKNITKSINKSRLSNLGNTCYQNAVLHPLFHTPDGFIEYIMSGYYLDSLKNYDDDEICKTLIYQFHRIVNSIYKKNTSELNINTWKHLVGEKNCFFEGFEQQDSQEFLSFIIEKFTEEVGNKLKVLPTKKVIIDDLNLNSKILNIKADSYWEEYHKNKYSLMVPFFSGLFRTKLVYNDSNAVATSFAPFTVLPLSIPKKEDNINLEDCLQLLTKEENLDKNNLIKGNLSYGTTFCTKRETLWKLPKYLIFQIKRFKYNDYGQITMKDNSNINYPLELNMTEYIDESSKYRKLNNNYKLYGITLHFGMMMNGISGGHYVAYVKNRTNGLWYLYNDDDNPKRIKKNNLVNSNAYLLYYYRDD